jgi:hypothetical protein
MLGTPSQGTRRSAQEILAEAAEIRFAGKRKPSRGAKSKEKNYGATAG